MPFVCVVLVGKLAITPSGYDVGPVVSEFPSPTFQDPTWLHAPAEGHRAEPPAGSIVAVTPGRITDERGTNSG